MITGKIEKKEFSEGMSDKGAWKRCAFTINGKKYSTFDEQIMNTFNAGQVVTITGTQDGQYFNMKTMVLANDDDNTRRPSAKPVVSADTSNKITRMACLKAAVEFFKGSTDEEKNCIGTEVILACAEQFETWVNR